MTDTTHECPAPGCSKRVPFEQFACRSHWWSIPALTRAQLRLRWLVDPGSEAYFEARADCLRALGVPDNQVADLNAGTT